MHQTTGKIQKSEIGRKFLECYESKAYIKAADILTWADIEAIDFDSPVLLDSQMKRQPILLNATRFPSLGPWMKASRSDSLLIFDSWRPSEYPRHTFEQRINLVASGELREKKCRWGASEVSAAQEFLEISEYPIKSLKH